MGAALPRALRELGVAAEAHVDHFADGTPDESWLRDARARGWVVVTADRRVATAPLARERLRTAGVGCFVLPAAGRTRMAQIAILSRAWARMQEVSERVDGGYVCRIRPDGGVDGAAPKRRVRPSDGARPARRRARTQPRLPGLD